MRGRRISPLSRGRRRRQQRCPQRSVSVVDVVDVGGADHVSIAFRQERPQDKGTKMSHRCNGGSCPAVVDQHGENSRQEDIFERPESTAGRVRRRRIIGHGVFFFFLTFVHQPPRDGAPDNGNARAPEQEAEDNLKESDPDQRRPGHPPPTTCEHRPLARAPQGHEERRRQDDVVEARVGGVTRIRQDARGAVRPIAVVALVHAAKATGGAARPPSTIQYLV